MSSSVPGYAQGAGFLVIQNHKVSLSEDSNGIWRAGDATGNLT